MCYYPLTIWWSQMTFYSSSGSFWLKCGNRGNQEEHCACLRNILVFHQTYSKDTRTREVSHLAPFSGEECMSFPLWWRQNTRTLELLDVSQCFQGWFLLEMILQSARSALTTETLTSGALEGIWKDLHRKFGGSLEMIKYYINLYVSFDVHLKITLNTNVKKYSR